MKTAKNPQDGVTRYACISNRFYFNKHVNVFSIDRYVTFYSYSCNSVIANSCESGNCVGDDNNGYGARLSAITDYRYNYFNTLDLASSISAASVSAKYMWNIKSIWSQLQRVSTI